ncbi:MAG TPA: heavy metal translocating P-type ATPase [Gemmatimonadaceae bacterium]|jgi:heavy metal translocating P-type ATPase|nr:heavy metal translocating P-type ATPase [Gemmatimonadaceae bacterium]
MSGRGKGARLTNVSREEPARPGLHLPQLALAFLAAGALVRLTSGPSASATVWMVGLVVTGAPVVWKTMRSAASGHFATDLVATLAVVTSVVLVEPLAGLVIVLMQTGGEALERYAEGRASSAVRALEEEAPRIAHRLRNGGTAPTNGDAEDIEVGEIVVGDHLLVRPGEMVPCDGIVIDGSSHVDTSRLTGEPIPERASAGTTLASGTLNLDGPLVLRATATAGASQYARIVELVRTAQSSKAPLQRLADRYAVWFTPLTLAACGVTYLASGDVDRVLAVLVVATPCPLILATPIAIIGGVNRAARRLIVVRHGGAFEQLAGVTAAVFDKTGTLTVGTPSVSDVVPAAGWDADAVLATAAAVEHGSGHLLARSVVAAAEERGLAIPAASAVREAAGQGVAGEVDGRAVCVGSRSFVADCGAADAPDEEGLRAHVAIGGAYAGAIEFADQLRPQLPALFDGLAALGIRRRVLLSGDSAAHTAAVARAIGVTEARGELLPSDKVDAVARMVREGERVVMVGDGTNDAPALSTATVGVALAGHGGGITAEAADVVILSDDVSRVVEAIRISRRTLRIARQSIWVGLGLSGAAMVVAALGHIPPAVGALLQEGIDVAVIVNALRTSVQPRASGASTERRNASAGTAPSTAIAAKIATAPSDWDGSAR